jgi:hypothetical protein
MIAFKEFLDTTVRKEFKQKIEEIEKAEKEKRRLNDIRIIKSERDFFRQEAIRLNNLCKELGGKIDELNRELKFQTSELMNMTKKWKDCENTNKQLIFELERNIQFSKELDDRYHDILREKNSMVEENIYLNSNKEEKTKNDFDFHHLMETENLENFNQEKLIKIIERLKNDFKKEKFRNHKILKEFNKLTLNEDKLQKIFESCVEEIRKDIHNRKLKDLAQTKSQTTLQELKDVKLDHFHNIDKKKLLEKFLLNDEVVEFIKEHLNKKKSGEMNMMKFHHSSKDFNKQLPNFSKTEIKFHSNSKIKILSPIGNKQYSVYNRTNLNMI